MVSVDRNTLISQIVSLNPQLKPDELHELSDAQLQAKLSQCIAGNKQDKNVDSVRINNSSSEASETPKMTTEEAQDNAIENIESNAEQAQNFSMLKMMVISVKHITLSKKNLTQNLQNLMLQKSYINNLKLQSFYVKLNKALLHTKNILEEKEKIFSRLSLKSITTTTSKNK